MVLCGGEYLFKAFKAAFIFSWFYIAPKPVPLLLHVKQPFYGTRTIFAKIVEHLVTGKFRRSAGVGQLVVKTAESEHVETNCPPTVVLKMHFY